MILLLGAHSVAMAGEDPGTPSVELKFLGNFRSKPVFELQFTNHGTAHDYILTIRDQFGNALYRESIESSTLTKKFMINTDELEDEVLRIEVSSRKNDQLITYQINRSSHTVEEVKINKVH